MRDCSIADGDELEMTIRFGAHPSVTKLLEPVGFYEVSPHPAATGVMLYNEITVHLINIDQAVEGQPCLALLADVDAEPVPSVQVWQPPNVLKLVPRAPMRPGTLYTVTLNLALDAVGATAAGADRYDISCVPDGVDTLRPYCFAWHFQTVQTGSADVGLGQIGAAPQLGEKGRSDPTVLDAVHGLLARPLDGFSRKQLLLLQADLGCMLTRVDGAIRHIDHKIDTINMRLQERGMARLDAAAQPAGAGTAGAPPAEEHEAAQCAKKLRGSQSLPVSM